MYTCICIYTYTYTSMYICTSYEYIHINRFVSRGGSHRYVRVSRRRPIALPPLALRSLMKCSVLQSVAVRCRAL